MRRLKKQATNPSLYSAASASEAKSPLLTSSSAFPSILTDGRPLPRAVVFDLDYTLWPFWVDTHVYGPIKPKPSSSSSPSSSSATQSQQQQQQSTCVTSVVDKTGETFAFYRDVPLVLHGLAAAGVRLGVASRTCAPDLAKEMLKMLHIPGVGSLVAQREREKAVGGFGAGGVGGGNNTNILGSPTVMSPSLGAGDGDEDGAGGGGGLPPTPTTPMFGGRKNSSFSSASGGGGAAGGDEKARKSIEFFDMGLEIYPSSKIRHFKALGKGSGVAHEDMLFFDDESRNRDTESLGLTMWLVRDGVTWQEVVAGIEEWRRRRGV